MFGRRSRQWIANWRRVQTLSIREARGEATRLLADSEAYEIVELAAAQAFENWAPELREVFARYERIESRISGAELSRSHIGPLAFHPGFTIIGSNQLSIVAVRTEEDRIFEFLKDGEPPDWLQSPLPSVWHWIVWTHFIGD